MSPVISKSICQSADIWTINVSFRYGKRQGGDLCSIISCLIQLCNKLQNIFTNVAVTYCSERQHLLNIVNFLTCKQNEHNLATLPYWLSVIYSTGITHSMPIDNS